MMLLGPQINYKIMVSRSHVIVFFTSFFRTLKLKLEIDKNISNMILLMVVTMIVGSGGDNDDDGHWWWW